MKYHWMLFMALVVFGSCTSNKKFKAVQSQYKALSDQYVLLEKSMKDCETAKNDKDRQLALSQKEIEGLTKEVAYLKENNTAVLNQLKDLSVISGSQAESIKKSMENISSKDSYIQTIQSAAARKDSLNMTLIMNLKGEMSNMKGDDVEIKVEKGIVLISLSDKMLFKSGSYELSDRANEVLGKVAKVLNNQPDLEILIEGHTDNIPISKPGIKDNWDLSALRATSVARSLQNNHNINPARMTAGGRSEYSPLMSNDTPEGKSANRRTRIIVMPQLDQFFKLLEKKV